MTARRAIHHPLNPLNPHARKGMPKGHHHPLNPPAESGQNLLNLLNPGREAAPSNLRTFFTTLLHNLPAPAGHNLRRSRAPFSYCGVAATTTFSPQGCQT